ncbi:MAG: sensor histidine kinase [Streptosporangiaceae bacterium]
MWMLMIVVWRMLNKVLRRFGRWALLVPVVAIGVAVFTLNVWMPATVLLALLLAVLLALVLLGQRSVNTTDLLPVSMLCTGICGLWAAASLAGLWAVRGFSVFAPLNLFVGPGQFKVRAASANAASKAQAAVSSGPPAALKPPPGITVKPGAILHGNWAAKAGPGGAFQRMVRPRGVIPAHSLWQGRLLILGSLLLLAIGLWLAPRALARLRAQYTKVAPHLRRWQQEGNWGILLVPVTSLGLTVFGVRPWTIAAIVAAIVITIRWPKLAADLVPLVLVVFAVYGFMLVSRWVPGPRVIVVAKPARFGAVDVDGTGSSLLAGVEASMLLAFGAWLFPRTIGAHGKRASGQDVELAGRVRRLTETRDQAADAAAAELRRIERDLHDGAQARLVALGMNLRALERMLPGSTPAALALVAEARETSLRALNDLRGLIRGIYPPVLADRGLAHAVQALALDTPLPVDLDIDLPGRLTAPVESACYFAIAEVLANAVKHSGARLVHIRVQHAAGMLRVEVADDGTGGADPAVGTGLSGVEKRLGAFDGIMAVSSPVGGPTMIAMEVPCVLSAPKTSSR